VIVGSEPLRHGQVCHGTVLYSSRLAHLRYDTACWLREEPGDWNLWRRMAALGARVAHLPQVVLARAPEGGSVAHAGDVFALRRRAEDLAPDVLGTDARWLLDVAPVPVCAPTS
jgi:hypothetical protein